MSTDENLEEQELDDDVTKYTKDKVISHLDKDGVYIGNGDDESDDSGHARPSLHGSRPPVTDTAPVDPRLVLDDDDGEIHIAKPGTSLLDEVRTAPRLLRDSLLTKALHTPRDCTRDDIADLIAAVRSNDLKARKAIKHWASSFGPFGTDVELMRLSGVVRLQLNMSYIDPLVVTAGLENLLECLPEDQTYFVELPSMGDPHVLVCDLGEETFSVIAELDDGDETYVRVDDALFDIVKDALT